MDESFKKKIAIGTAQFGNNYGVTNSFTLHEPEVKKIINLSEKLGINTLDTAPDYNNYSLLSKLELKKFKVVSKYSIKKYSNSKKIDIVDDITSYLEKLNIKKLDALLFRNPLLLFKNKNLWSSAKALQRKNIINKVGYTVYSPKELDEVVNIFSPDIVQLPYNIFDKRFLLTGWLEKLYLDKVEVHVRSIFLQGLLLEDLKKIPKNFSDHIKVFKMYEKWLNENNLLRIEACMSIFNNDKRISKIIVGLQNSKELKKIFHTDERILKYPKWMEKVNESLINPVNW